MLVSLETYMAQAFMISSVQTVNALGNSAIDVTTQDGYPIGEKLGSAIMVDVDAPANYCC